MHQKLADCLEQILLMETIPDLEALCANILGHYGIQHFLCTNMYGLECSVDRRPMFGTWDSDWAKRLVRHSYFVEDPTVQYCMGIEGDGLPYYWSEIQIKKKLTPAQNSVFKAAWEAELHDGIVFPLQTGVNELAVFSMAGREFKPDPSVKGILHSIAIQSHTRSRQILLRDNPKGFMPNRIGLSVTRDVSSLTDSEHTVIQLLAEDFGPQGIAELKGISVSTVRKHIASAKRKLHVDEQAGLVSVAIRHKLIT